MKKEKRYMILSIIAVLIASVSVSYAFFTARITGQETTSTIVLKGGEMSIHYSNLSSIIEVEDIYPRKEPWVIKNFTVTGTNTTNLNMKYSLWLDKNINTFPDNYLTYSLETVSFDSGSPVANLENEPIAGTGEELLGEGLFFTGSNVEHSYTFKIFFKDNGEDQSGAKNAKFAAKIDIHDEVNLDPNESPQWWVTPPKNSIITAIKASYPDAATKCGKAPTTTPGIDIAFTNEGINCTEDDYGKSFYYRGAITNNYVEFANMCWRIVRITGDGSVKLTLFNENLENSNTPCTEIKPLGAFAKYDGVHMTTEYGDPNSDVTNAKLGIMYGDESSHTYEGTHQNLYDNEILIKLKMWYDRAFTSDTKAQLADVIWCNDKRILTGTGIGTDDTRYYGSQLIPSLMCGINKDDNKISKFTASDTEYGNGMLRGVDGEGNSEYRIGLLTADEVAFSGLTKDIYYADYYSHQSVENHTPYILHNAGNDFKNNVSDIGVDKIAEGISFWTLTPYQFKSESIMPSRWSVIQKYTPYNASVSATESLGLIECGRYDEDCGEMPVRYLRPTIAIKSNLKATGTGTAIDPYVIES